VDGRGQIPDIGVVSSDEIDRLLAGLTRGSIDPSASVSQLRRAGLLTHAERLHAWLNAAVEVFGTTPAMLAALRLIQAERQRATRTTPTAELILTGPGLEGAEARETRVVVRELFESARHSVLIVGYVFHGSDHIFEPMARTMSRNAALRVRLIVNVPYARGRAVDEAVRGFARDFLEDSWPFEPRPEIYYDPRSLERSGPERAIAHAKLIVVDEEVLYLGSADFTTAAFERNIEAGVRIKSSTLGKKASEQFDRWIRRGDLVPLPIAGIMQ
jgi:phosphatidylserine/phosphatidylglycerophosphate/cardiolipin synthase-like enzyme